MNIESEDNLGEILLVKLYKDARLLIPEDSWYCQYVTVKAPNNAVHNFPCYSWLVGESSLTVIEGKARRKCEYQYPILEEHWVNEIQSRQEAYQWSTFVPGIPRNIKAESASDLPKDAQFTLDRKLYLIFDLDSAFLDLGMNSLKDSQKMWNNLEEVQKSVDLSKVPVAAYVVKHWKEDTFFGYQYMNGSNPQLIKQCTHIPSKFPVTDEMVSSSLGPGTSLQEELQKGNIYIVDYEILHGIPANSILGKQQYLEAPMCLLYSNPENDLIPIAIQIRQEPGPQNPIFLPSDGKYDWCLAKIWVRHADAQIHQLLSHLLETHLFAEIFCVATLRKLPNAHPLFKLLMPHLKYTLHINTGARELLISDGGVIDKAFSTGGAGKVQILQRAMDQITYSYLCLPEDLASRGVERLPKYYYRDDALKIWFAINRFVENIVKIYYKDDATVLDDSEIQEWATEIFTEGFLARQSSGFPTMLQTRAELIKFLTMIIFTCSGRHAAVNTGQFDWGSWMPNNPSTMQKPAPSEKGKTGMFDIMCTLPGIQGTAIVVATIYLLSKTSPSATKLGTYVEERFTEAEPRACIETFQKDLQQITLEIEKRNESLELKYEYLLPDLIENSIAI
ncbi:polyunsaturated fatty acid lipoxygenase ALOX15B-like isoform X2 [Mustelus asterias]